MSSDETSSTESPVSLQTLQVVEKTSRDLGGCFKACCGPAPFHVDQKGEAYVPTEKGDEKIVYCEGMGCKLFLNF